LGGDRLREGVALGASWMLARRLAGELGHEVVGGFRFVLGKMARVEIANCTILR
jgi:hypothetical protein